MAQHPAPPSTTSILAEDEADAWEDVTESDAFYLHPYGRMAAPPATPMLLGAGGFLLLPLSVENDG